MPYNITTFIDFRLNSEDSSDSVVFEHNFNETGLSTSQVRFGDQAQRLKTFFMPNSTVYGVGLCHDQLQSLVQ